MNFKPLKTFLDECLGTIGVPGSDTIVYKGHNEVFRYQSGFNSIRQRTPVRPDAMYNIYSVTKVSLAICAMQLLERGLIQATDPLYAYFPEYKNMRVKRIINGRIEITDAKNPILIKHLMSMTSGINYSLSRPALTRVKEATGGRCPTLDIVRALAEEPLEFEPGTDYLYGLNHDIMGGVIELVSGMKLSQYMRNNIFLPLGLRDTYFTLPAEKHSRLATQYNYDKASGTAIEISAIDMPYRLGTEYESGGAGLVSTVSDQILIADALTHFGKGKNGERILSGAGVNLMRKNLLPEVGLRSIGSSIQNAGYGYAWGVRTNLSPECCGNLMPVGEFGWDGAKLCYMSCCPESRISIFHAEHMGGLHATVIPRLRNLVYSCIDD